MADFRNKKIRTFFDNELRDAGAEDIALLIAVLQPVLTEAMERIKKTSTAQGVVLDPLPQPKAQAATSNGQSAQESIGAD